MKIYVQFNFLKWYERKIFLFLRLQADGRTHKGKILESFGGVGRNLAEALITLGASETKLVSAIGSDGAGRAIRENLKEAGQLLEMLDGISTARYRIIKRYFIRWTW